MKNIVKTLFMIFALSLPGCAAFFDGPDISPKRNSTNISFELTENLPPNIDGQATVLGNFCLVKLRPSVYPRCIKHEVMHCFGWKHDDRPNSEYCNDE